MVNDTTPYHLSAHGAGDLLGPIADTLRELEARTQQYLNHIPLDGDADAEALRAAQAALEAARAQIGALLDPGDDLAGASQTRKLRVLITGAGGSIGGSLAELLREHFDLRLLYRTRRPETPPSDDWVMADLADLPALEAAMQGVDAVVHMAADPEVDATWESVLQNNIIGTYNVFEAARRAGVPRIVFASTNHVMGMYDRDGMWPIFADQPIRPDSLYGVSKAFGEALGRFWYDQHGVSVICLRIGWMLPEPHDEIARWMWLSPRDCAQIVTRAIESHAGFEIVYAISQNAARRWDITQTIERFGYRPEDDAETRFASAAAADTP
ncbi:MAG: NAD(P)-dependent oxidoreductase [Thermomicrobiales bacterium]